MKYILTLITPIILCVSIFGHNDIKEGYHFTANEGQYDSHVHFYSRLKIGNMFLEKDRFTFDLYSGSELDSLHNIKNAKNAFENKEGIPYINTRTHADQSSPLKKHTYSMIFEGHNPNVSVSSAKKLDGYKNYFIGNDESKWVTNVPSFKEVNYHNIYNNIDMQIYTSFDWMKYDFIVRPGGNTEDISIKYDGVEKLYLDEKGLVIKLSTGEVREVKCMRFKKLMVCRLLCLVIMC